MSKGFRDSEDWEVVTRGGELYNFVFISLTTQNEVDSRNSGTRRSGHASFTSLQGAWSGFVLVRNVGLSGNAVADL